MDKLTKLVFLFKYAEYQKAHMKMWAWLADNPAKSKDDWPGWQTWYVLGRTMMTELGFHVLCNAHCFGCAVCAEICQTFACQRNEDEYCRFCPLWEDADRKNHGDGVPPNGDHDKCLAGLYQHWYAYSGPTRAHSPDMLAVATKYAQIIAGLEWKNSELDKILSQTEG